jgi:hypothetical protein
MARVSAFHVSGGGGTSCWTSSTSLETQWGGPAGTFNCRYGVRPAEVFRRALRWEKPRSDDVVDAESPNSSCTRIIRSLAGQRTPLLARTFHCL